jgi:hypothetical protein
MIRSSRGLRRSPAADLRGHSISPVSDSLGKEIGDFHEQTSSPAALRRTLLLTGASRGIGHATVKRFSAAGWRVISCSRHAFPENCPWEMGRHERRGLYSAHH